MTDWTVIAKGRGLNIPAQELAAIVPSLDALDESFRPLVRGLTPEVEPGAIFRPEEENS
jgi:hypothetical protein